MIGSLRFGAWGAGAAPTLAHHWPNCCIPAIPFGAPLFTHSKEIRASNVACFASKV